mmetsp:Transcript_10518/g.23899  ORF Transcript_10518/g.23899 Transcript_10518/m.23899 type:complete len:830 (+) Transcript_10518:133-2622(+)|eukprot:CAMPEP_0178379552 /NCGR_PEP_ID=MMETSP0689_2-20121128/5002_1 /TAXON_ID=160604 /ORGANISM="Amphidinium massartii, Strain CS-259" /LENGTH=829 /DNA_ID=CAMNT_0019999659 /DNA_START=36 /DNA_END=2525 /DNA_ORIENTATION=+
MSSEGEARGRTDVQPANNNSQARGWSPSVERLRDQSQAILQQAKARGSQLQQGAQLAAEQAKQMVGKATTAVGLGNLAPQPVPCAVCGQPTLNGDGGAVGDLSNMTAEAGAPAKEADDALRVAVAAELAEEGIAVKPPVPSTTSTALPARCRSCLTAAEVEQVAEAAAKRELALKSFLAGQEEVHAEPEEGKVEMGYRVGLMAMGGVNSVLTWIPGISQIATTMKVIETVLRYGPLALYANEIVESVALLAFLGNQVGDKPNAQDMADLSIGAYYMMIEGRNKRGLDPEMAQREHTGCPPVSLTDIKRLSSYLMLSNPIAYSSCAAEAQRQLHLLDGNWGLVFAEAAGPGAQPPHFVAVHRDEKRAAVLIPGTQNATDVVTDLKALPLKVSLGANSKKAGWAHRGMLRAATAIVRSTGPILEKFEKEGYETMFVGHSLGAAISALSAMIMHLGDEGPRSDKVKAYCYAMPACGDAVLGHFCRPFVTAVINCDDVVPRLSLQTAKKLRAELEARREDYRRFAQIDMEALKDVKGLVSLKRRKGAEGASESNADSSSNAATDPQLYSQDLEEVEEIIKRSVSSSSAAAAQPPTGSAASAPPTASTNQAPEVAAAGNKKPVQAKQPPQKKASGWSLFGACMSGKGVDVDNEVSFDAAPPKPATPKPKEEDEASDEETIEESFVAKDVVLYPVGKIVHLYRSCGARRAVWIKRTHPALHRIEMEQGLAADHRGPAYKGALEEATAFAQGKKPPQWKPFASVPKCSCCSEAFGWDSNLKSEPHKYQAQHHCSLCGSVACTSCCQTRKPLPQLGIMHEVRICDRCVLKGGGSGTA